VPAFFATNTGIFTNTSPTGPYRGAGRPEAAYVIERLMDEAAQELAIDPVQIRRLNLIRPEQMPYSTHTGFVYDSGNFPALLDQCLELSDAEGFAARRAESEGRGQLRGRGVAFFIEQGSVFNDQMTIRFDPGGGVTILAGTHSHGQGHATVFAQLVSEWLGVPFESIRHVQGDTDKVAFGRGTYAARSSMIGGCALKLAADQIIEKAKKVSAVLLGVDPATVQFEQGVFASPVAARSLRMAEVAQACFAKAGPLSAFGVGLEATGVWNTDPPNFPNGCHICEVEIDPQTGVTHVQRYNAVDDIGRALNPMICEGQMHGGIAQGIGQALYEHVVYDPDSGQLVSGTFMDYGMPRADDMPEFALRLAEIPCKTNPLGVKAVGEAGTIGAPPAVMNAVLDALRARRVRHLDMPATPLRVWQALQGETR
jgi:carbon-monoxide dehydrogenase large subunit